MKQFALFLLLIIFVTFGCNKGKSRLEVDVSKVSVSQVIIHRYDLDLFAVKISELKTDLEKLRPRYPFFLDTDLNDTSKLLEMRQYLENPRNREFYTAVAEKYPNLANLEEKLTDAFRHIKFYYPGFNPPRVYAYISGGDYNYPVQFADSVLLIGLDNYLGSSFKPYVGDGLPAYRISRMNEEQILTDCIKILIDRFFPRQIPGNNLLEQMVDAGKRLYLQQAMLPHEEFRQVIGYSEMQHNWIVKNERYVWAAIISNRMLYSTDGQLIRSFLADGPFTADFSKESPPRLGEWIGWKIVGGYMENQPEISPEAMMAEKDAQKMLASSGYKPGD